MILPFIFSMATELPNRVVPHALGVQSGRCFAKLRNGERILYGARNRSQFVFDRDYALEGYNVYDGGGMGVYKRYGSEWCVITRGGGALSESDLARFGVPAPVSHRLFHPKAAKASEHR